jgi:hypothetical protein
MEEPALAALRGHHAVPKDQEAFAIYFLYASKRGAMDLENTGQMPAGAYVQFWVKALKPRR